MFNNINYRTLERLAGPGGDTERTALPIAVTTQAPRSGDRGARRPGYDAFDAGPLSEGWRFQRDTVAYGLYVGEGGLLDPRRRNADEVRDELDKAVRYRDM